MIVVKNEYSKLKILLLKVSPVKITLVEDFGMALLALVLISIKTLTPSSGFFKRCNAPRPLTACTPTRKPNMVYYKIRVKVG